MPSIPGSAGMPVIGDKTLEYYRDAVQFVQRRIEQHHSRIFMSRVLNKPTVFVASNVIVREILKDHAHNMDLGYKAFMHDVLGDNILFKDGKEADALREVFHSLLGHETLQNFQQTIVRLVNKAMENIDVSEPICAYKMFKKLTTEICLTLFLNIDFDTASELAKEICDLTTMHWHGIISVPVNLKLPFMTSSSGFGKAIEAKNKLLEIIESHLKATSNGFPQQACEANFQSHQEAAGHLLLLTSALVPKAIASILTSYVIATDLYTKREVLQAAVKDDEVLRSLLLETQRMWPPFPGGRRLVRHDFRVGGYHIHKGHAVVYSTYGAQRDPEIFKNPNSFQPERWRNNSSLNPDMLVCYGSGSRSCVGKHLVWNILQAAAHALTSQYRWRISENQDLEYKWLPVARPKENMMVQFTRWSGETNQDQ